MRFEKSTAFWGRNYRFSCSFLDIFSCISGDFSALFLQHFCFQKKIEDFSLWKSQLWWLLPTYSAPTPAWSCYHEGFPFSIPSDFCTGGLSFLTKLFDFISQNCIFYTLLYATRIPFISKLFFLPV